MDGWIGWCSLKNGYSYCPVKGEHRVVLAMRTKDCVTALTPILSPNDDTWAVRIFDIHQNIHEITRIEVSDTATATVVAFRLCFLVAPVTLLWKTPWWPVGGL